MARKICILLIEDDSEVRNSLRNVLMGENYNVLVAADADQAMSRMQLEPPDIALVDHCLAEKHGWRLLTQLREADPKLCTIVMSAEAVSRQATLRADISAFVEKPLNLPLLISKIQDLSLQRARLNGWIE